MPMGEFPLPPPTNVGGSLKIGSSLHDFSYGGFHAPREDPQSHDFGYGEFKV